VRRAGAVVVGLVALLLLWWSRSGPDAPVQDVAAGNMPAVQLPPAAPPAAPAPAEKPAAAEKATLVVVVGTGEAWTMLGSHPAPSEVFATSLRTSAHAWPTVPSAAIPEGPWLTEDGALVQMFQHPEVIDDALASGHLFGEAPTPGARMLEAELLKTWAELEQRDAMAAYEQRHGIPSHEEDPAGRGAAMRAAMEVEPRPRAPTDEALARVDELLHAESDPGVADVLKLARLQLLLEPGHGRSNEAALDLALELASEASSPIVQDDAIQFLADQPLDLDIPADVLDALEELHTDESAEVLSSALAGLGLGAAQRLQDPERVARWLAHFRAAFAPQCERAPDGPICASIQLRIRAVEGHLVSQGVASPGSWQAAVVGSIHRCAEHVTGRETRGGGRYQSSWSWDVPDLGSCLSSQQLGGPVPPAGQEVELVVIDPERRRSR